MVKRLAALLIILSILPLLCGCWFLLGGAAGYEMTSDSARGHYDTSSTRAYKASQHVMQTRGNITMQDEKSGWIKADIGNYNVAVHIEQLTERTVQTTVSARKYTLPKPQFAREILSKISKELR